MAYFPNGSSGGVLDAQCSDCPLGYGWNTPGQGRLFDESRSPLPCPTALVQLMFNYDQCDEKNAQLREAMTMLVSEDGTCETRKLLVQRKIQNKADSQDAKTKET